MSTGCIFCRIAAKEIPSNVVYEDAEFLAFRDIHPQAPAHAVVIPKAHVATALDFADAEQAGRFLQAGCEAAKADGLVAGGFRLVVNYGRDGGQEVPHVHMHLLGGRLLGWPPG